jgi:hypothetical protein
VIDVHVSADTAGVFKALDVFSTAVMKPMGEVLGFGKYAMMRSLAARTKQSKKLRKIVENPDPRAAADGRRANYGVYVYARDGQQKFLPIWKGGEFGAHIKYLDRHTVLLKTSEGWVKRPSGTGEFQVAGLAQHPKRIIRRRGLAKRSWKVLQGRGKSTATFRVMDVNALADQAYSETPAPTFVITNRVRYMEAALIGGTAAITAAEGAATSYILKNAKRVIDDTIRRTFK